MKESEKNLQASYDELKKKYMEEKSKVGGYMTSNNNYKARNAKLEKDNAALKVELQKAKDYGKEADEMLNERIVELDEKKRIIAGLQSQVVSLGKTIKDNETTISGLLDSIAYLKKPWWKRVF